jgi:hypothetical protein
VQVGVKSEFVPMYYQLISNSGLLGPVYYQATVELDNIPEIDVAEQKQRLGEDMPIAHRNLSKQVSFLELRTQKEGSEFRW